MKKHLLFLGAPGAGKGTQAELLSQTNSYLHLSTGELLRKEIEMDHEYFRKKIEGSQDKKMWGEMKGEKLKTSPKGFDREHPANDLLQYKQYIFSKKVDHKTIFSREFETFIIDHFKTLLPVLNYMGEVLNTNLDGESLL